MRARAAIAVLAMLGGPLAAAQEYAPGEKLTMINCGRCHKVSEKDRMGGIGSTPSFGVMRNWVDGEQRMKAFWTLRPHPAFTQLEGVTEPFPSNRPSPIHPISLTQDDLRVIIEYFRSIEPADLGPDLGLR